MRQRFAIPLLALLVLAIAVAFPRQVVAQTRTQQKAAPAAEEQKLSSTDKLLLYESQKKSEVGALLIEGAVPFVGHAYAGNVRKGLIPAGCRVGSFVLMIAGMSYAVGDAYSGDGGGGAGLMTVGLLGYTGCSVWDAVAAYQNAASHNSELRRRLGIVPTFGIAPVRIGGHQKLSLAFSIPVN